jgi:hypothetical protein
MKDKIEIKSIETGEITAKFEKSEVTEIGKGNSAKEAVENLFYLIESNEKKTAHEKEKLFIEKNMKMAKELATQFFLKTGPDYFTLQQFTNKTEIEKEDAKLRLNFLTQFGLVQPDRKKGAGKRYKIEVDSESLKQYYFNEAEKWESTSKYYRALSEELDSVDAKIKEEAEKVG